MEYFQYGKVRAVLEPKRLDTLKPAAKQFIGREGIFKALWWIEADDGDGCYAGQLAMHVPNGWIDEIPEDFFEGFIWVPQEDLRVLEVLDAGFDYRD